MKTFSATYLAKTFTNEQIDVLRQIRDQEPLAINTLMLQFFRRHKLADQSAKGPLETTPKGRKVLMLRARRPVALRKATPVVGVGFNEASNDEAWSYFVHVKIGGVRLVSDLCSKAEAKRQATLVRKGLRT